jgi:hypothetical protein
MKNIMIAGSILLLYTATANAQSESSAGKDEKETKAERFAKRNSITVSYQSSQAFLRDFPDAGKVNWKTIAPFEIAEFNSKGIVTKAFYDMDNELVGTTTEKSFTDIPLIAQKYIQRKYSGYTTENVILFDDNEYNDTDMELYGTPFEDEDNYFVSLKNDKETILLKVNMSGDVSFFKKL